MAPNLGVRLVLTLCVMPPDVRCHPGTITDKPSDLGIARPRSRTARTSVSRSL
ncbi:hypothetical protein [Streptosporangium sp. CA-115845]|uniref:hypothetical protein n=1 Tax=Streptosporangium sp. CA-115845 TaxID=3240071 RepID=UPI003D913DF9